MKIILSFFCFALLTLACNQPEKPAATAANPPAETPNPTEHCFENRLPDGSVLTLRYTEDGKQVEGVLDYTFAEKDGAHGTIEGTKEGNLIRALWTYTVEGSVQNEQVMIRIEGDKAVKASGELVEGAGGVLELKDPEQATWAETFPRVECK